MSYGRQHNPTWELLERSIADLEDASGCLSYASGMAGIAAVLELVPAGGKVVVALDAYNGSRKLLRRLEARGRCEVEWVDVTDANTVAAAAQGASMVWIETIGNPLLTVPDLSRSAAAAHAAGALLVVDNTFATPILCRPLNFGADVVLHSASKYIGGHDDLMLGVIATSREQEGLLDELREHRTHAGGCPGQMEAWLALRGLRTLDVRVRRQVDSAARIADSLAKTPGVLRVHFPGLAAHPQHDLAARQLDGGFGAMVSIELAADAEHAERFCAATKIWTNATSLGSVGSLLERRGRWAGEEALPPGLVRLSVGVEDPEDLLADLSQALVAAEVAV
jgi:cystathionine gamma-synthase